MQTELEQITSWIRNGTLEQFYTKVSAKIGEEGYRAELEGDTLTFYRSGKRGGFLGMGSRRTGERVLQITCTDDQVTIPEEFVDQKFVARLVGLLGRR